MGDGQDIRNVFPAGRDTAQQVAGIRGTFAGRWH
jgi:hypothetical protein